MKSGWLLCLIFAFSSAFAKTEFQKMSEGRPHLWGVALPDETYVPVEMKRLASPILIWKNTDWFSERKMNVSDQEILDQCAWGVPNPDDAPGLFLEDTRRIFYADRYGGRGTNGNLGSGRGVSAGIFQWKGPAATPLVNRMETDAGHSSGRMPFEEGVREVIWGEINQELPYGGSRAIALIDMGDGNTIVVREDPLRPAHYMEYVTVQNEALLAVDVPRQKKVLRYLVDALPQPIAVSVNASVESRLRTGMMEYVDRIAKQYAALFVHRLFHGATSLSNIRLDGGLLDLNVETAQGSYGKIKGKVWTFEDASGETEKLKVILIQEFNDSLKKRLDAKLASALPSTESLLSRFDRVYLESVQRGFVSLTGIPKVVLSQIESSPQSKALGELLESMAREKPLRAYAAWGAAELLNRYDVNRILVALAEGKSISAWVSDVGKEQTLIQRYSDFMKLAKTTALASGQSGEWFQDELIQNVRLLNRNRTELYSWNLMKNIGSNTPDAGKRINEVIRSVISKQRTSLSQRIANTKLVKSCANILLGVSWREK